jgi:hypothetical protein
MMFLQLPTPAPGSIENWLLPAVAVLSIVALVKKVFPTKPSDKNLVTKSELHQALDGVRDTIDARFLSLSEKIEHLGTSVSDKFTELKSAVSRIDERTKK